MNKRCIISFANRNGNYAQGLARLSDSLRNNFDGDFLAWIGEPSLLCKPHKEDNYSFKIAATSKAIESGYKQILWLDASCFAIGDLSPVFQIIENYGFVFQESGHYLGQWTNDKTLKYFGITRDEAMEIKLIGNAGFLGFDYSNKLARDFWFEYSKSQRLGYFNGAWNNGSLTESKDTRCKGHRHDISCATACLYKLGVLDIMQPGDKVLQYAGPYDQIRNDSILIKAQGL